MERRLLSEVVDVSVGRGATFAEAARALRESGLPTIAVIDEGRRVVGMFGVKELLRGLFPRYLGELHHTAFLGDDVPALAERAERASGEPVEVHMGESETVELDSSSTHLAERFLHSTAGAMAVVREGAFVGMLSSAAFCRALASRSER